MPAITDGYASISVTAPAGAVVTLAGNTHTMAGEPYSVNVEFGSYTIDVSYTDGDEVKTSSYTVEVDGYNDYAVDFNYTPSGFVVNVSAGQANSFHFITVNGNTYSASQLYSNNLEFRLPVGSVVTFSVSSGNYHFFYVDGTQVNTSSSRSYSYTVVSDCSILYKGTCWYITTSSTASGGVGDFDTPTVTVSANPATVTPLTIHTLQIFRVLQTEKPMLPHRLSVAR